MVTAVSFTTRVTFSTPATMRSTSARSASVRASPVISATRL
jgi:hypothetical protein